MWLTIVALILALSSGFISAWCYLALQERLKKQDVKPLLEQSSQSLLAELERKFRGLETEWDDMYQKFGRLAGRMDRQKALSPPTSTDEPAPGGPPLPASRSELLRRFRSKS